MSSLDTNGYCVRNEACVDAFHFSHDHRHRHKSRLTPSPRHVRYPTSFSAFLSASTWSLWRRSILHLWILVWASGSDDDDEDDEGQEPLKAEVKKGTM